MIEVGLAEGFRPNTKLNQAEVYFVLNDGGMGDYVNYASSIVWVAKNNRWVLGRLVAPRYLVPLLKDILREFDHWEVIAAEDFHPNGAIHIIGPTLRVDGQVISRQFFTCLHNHPIDVGFAYYAQRLPPEGTTLVTLDYPRERLHRKVRRVGKYVVIPTGFSYETRRIGGKELNPIIEHVKSKGLTPVFLGKKDPVGGGVRTTHFAGDIRFDLGLDLRDQTDVKQAACIMQHAEMTVGLDCGLLHLAALMKDSKIIFGYNIAAVEHRAPRRAHGKTINLALSEKSLPCIGCQSKYTNFVGHEFINCLYKDTACIRMLYHDDSKFWRDAIDQILEVAE